MMSCDVAGQNSFAPKLSDFPEEMSFEFLMNPNGGGGGGARNHLRVEPIQVLTPAQPLLTPYSPPAYPLLTPCSLPDKPLMSP